MEGAPVRFVLPPELRLAVLDHALACLPEEACGLLGGRAGERILTAERWLPVENALHSPVRFRMDPAAQLDGLNAIEAAGLDLVALFHSHPRGPRHPSPTDLAEFAYPGVLTLILSPGGPGWQFGAFWMDGVLTPDAAFTEIEIVSPHP